MYQSSSQSTPVKFAESFRNLGKRPTPRGISPHLLAAVSPDSYPQQPRSLCVMASESPQIERTPPQSGPGDQSGTPAAETAKRKAEQTNGTQTRTKRNRYISIAWYDYVLIRSDALSLGFLLRRFLLASTLSVVSKSRFVLFTETELGSS